MRNRVRRVLAGSVVASALLFGLAVSSASAMTGTVVSHRVDVYQNGSEYDTTTTDITFRVFSPNCLDPECGFGTLSARETRIESNSGFTCTDAGSYTGYGMPNNELLFVDGVDWTVRQPQRYTLTASVFTIPMAGSCGAGDDEYATVVNSPPDSGLEPEASGTTLGTPPDVTAAGAKTTHNPALVDDVVTVRWQVTFGADRDLDGYPDSTDRCPANAAGPGGNGCPQGVSPSTADLRVLISTRGPRAVGARLTYVLALRNPGPDAARHLLATLRLPSNTRYLGASRGCSRDHELVGCKSSVLASQASRRWIIRIVPRKPGRLTARAKAVSDAWDPVLANNSTARRITVRRHH